MTGREIIRLSHKKGTTHNGIHEEEQGRGRVKVVAEEKNGGVRKRNGRWILKSLVGCDGMNDLNKKARMGVD